VRPQRPRPIVFRLACALLELYPQAHRARYGDELRAVLEQGPVTVGTLFDLARGALDAHVHPGTLVASPARRMRGTVSAALSLWIALVVVGGAFAKTTEDAPFRNAEAAHPLLGGAHIAIVVLAVAAAGVVAVAGAPLALTVLRQAWGERSRSLRRAIAAPLTALACIVVALLVLKAALPPGTRSSNGTSLGHAAGVFFFALVLVVAGVFALGGRSAIHNARLGRVQLALAAGGAWLLARLMTAIALATAMYATLLDVYASRIEAMPNSPLMIATSICILAEVGAMVLISALALVTARRGLRAGV
jgi:hypothetical protein